MAPQKRQVICACPVVPVHCITRNHAVYCSMFFASALSERRRRISIWDRMFRFFSGLMKPKNAILGNESAGQIEAVNKGVRSFSVGDKVFGFYGGTFGAHAQYIVLSEDAPLATIPEQMTYEEAARHLSFDRFGLLDPKSVPRQNLRERCSRRATACGLSFHCCS
jgi:hypothetical protein